MKKRLLMICLACLMAVSVTACGSSTDDSGESEEAKSNTSSVSENDESSEESAESKDEPAPADSSESETETDRSEPETDESEPETEPENDEKFAYYDLLDAEYQKYGIWSRKDYAAADGYVLISDSSSLNRLEKENNRKPCLLIKEDGSYIDLWELDIFRDYIDHQDITYVGGYLYIVYWTNDKSCYFAKIDMDGNVIRNVKLGDEFIQIEALSGDGDAIITVMTVDGGQKYMLLKDDSDTLIEMPKLTIEGEHGLTVEVNKVFFNYAFYNNKIYAAAYENDNSYGFYLDCDDLSWHECEHIIWSNVRCSIGRYFILGNESGIYDSGVYDMETDTFVYNIPFIAGETYRGGDSNIVYSKDHYEEVRYPTEDNDDREIIRELVEETFNEKGGSDAVFGLMMSNTHYLYIDKYGIFVRSFENGAEDEKTVILIDN